MSVIQPFVPEFADRAPQVSAFEKILTGELPRKAFLIQGDSEIGKSFLLEQFRHMARQRLVSRLDFRDGEAHNFLSIIQTAIEDLGPEIFKAARTEIDRLTEATRHDITVRTEILGASEGQASFVNLQDIQGHIKVEGDLVGGDMYKNTIHLPPTDNRFQRQALQQNISSAFFEELRTLATHHSVFLSYDSFESAPPEAQQWLTGSLLDEVARGRLSGVVVIVAGRLIPEVAHMLIPHTVLTQLKNFDWKAAVEYWVNCRGLSIADLSNIYAETGGHPKRIAERANEVGGRPPTYQVLVIN